MRKAVRSRKEITRDGRRRFVTEWKEIGPRRITTMEYEGSLNVSGTDFGVFNEGRIKGGKQRGGEVAANPAV